MLKLATIILFVIGAIKARRKPIIERIFALLMLITASSTIYFDLSSKIFLGKLVAEAYRAEAPGFLELKAYERGTCTIGYGGILGVTDIFYLNYQTDNDTFWILSNEGIIDLEPSTIIMNGMELEIKRKHLTYKNQ